MSQLAWPQILSVALRLKVSEALLRSGHPLDIYKSDAPSAALLAQFEDIAKGELLIAGRHYRTPEDVAEEGAAIDAYLKRVRVKLDKHAKRLAEESAHARQLFAAMMTACGSAICHACCGAHACTWMISTSADDEKRMASGDCVQPVRDMFDWVCNAVARRHELAGVRPKIHPPRLVMGHGSRNTDLGLAINASTHRGTARGPSEIRMSFEPDKLWVPDYLSLIYVFAHECIAHAWCGIDFEAEQAEDSKLFHDGWMDVVAAEVLYDALHDPAHALPAYAKEIWRQTSAVRGVRLDASRDPPPADVWQWHSGVRAFDTLHFMFAHTLCHELESSGDKKDHWTRAWSESLRTVVDLSLRINVSTISHRERRDFVWSLLEHLSRNTPEATVKALTRNSQVIDFINEYRKIYDEKSLSGVS